MRAGRMTETIRLERLESVVNDYGTPQDEWQRYATARAERIDATTEERLRAFGATDEVSVIFRMRHLDGVLPADRVIWNTESYGIEQITPIGRRKGLDLRCRRVTP